MAKDFIAERINQNIDRYLLSGQLVLMLSTRHARGAVGAVTTAFVADSGAVIEWFCKSSADEAKV